MEGSGAVDAAADGAAGEDGQAGGAQAEEPSGAALQAVLGGGIARVVFRNAIAARPDDIELRCRFLDALAPFQLPGQPQPVAPTACWGCLLSKCLPVDAGQVINAVHRWLRVCAEGCRCHHAGAAAVEAEIFDSIARDFVGQPVAVDVMARRHNRTESEQQGLQVGSSAVVVLTLFQLCQPSVQNGIPCAGMASMHHPRG